MKTQVTATLSASKVARALTQTRELIERATWWWWWWRAPRSIGGAGPGYRAATTNTPRTKGRTVAHTRVNSLREVAAMIPADQAQLAVAKVMASLGAFDFWNADTLDSVAEAVREFSGVGGVGGGLPPIFDQDREATEFWQGIS